MPILWQEKRYIMVSSTSSDYFDISACAVSGGCLQSHSGPYLFGRHIHTSFEVYLIAQGNCFMNINGKIFPAKKMILL